MLVRRHGAAVVTLRAGHVAQPAERLGVVGVARDEGVVDGPGALPVALLDGLRRGLQPIAARRDGTTTTTASGGRRSGGNGAPSARTGRSSRR